MNQSPNRHWKILCWNVRGINTRNKWDAIKNKVVDYFCDIVCFQETKKEVFDNSFLKNVCPPCFDKFEFLPSVGASGGMLIAWESRFFRGQLVFSNQFAISVEFSSLHNNESWILTNVYGPCDSDGKQNFTNWLKQIEMPQDTDWIIMGDFNLIRKQEDRNKEGANIVEMFLFNESISAQGLNEVVLQGRKYTWSNMQQSPLLEKLDWVFTSNAWTISYPVTSVKALDRVPSDHCPCVVSISTHIPKTKIFRFENYWLQHEKFFEILSEVWATPNSQVDRAKIITAKMKKLRGALKEWKGTLSNLKTSIANAKLLIQFFEVIEEVKEY